MPDARYPAYRAFDEQRVAVNNAVMALTAGAQLAGHTLQLTEGSDLLLPQVFPNVPHIGRFNLTSSFARQVLSEAEDHIGSMAVPYILAIYEDHTVTSVLDLLATEGLLTRRQARDATSATMHQRVKDATGSSIDTGAEDALDLLRLMRNAVIHAGGRAGSPLVNGASNLSTAGAAAWAKVVGVAPPQFVRGERVVLGHNEVVLALATTKRLARGTNALLQKHLARDTWADMAVAGADARLTLKSWNSVQRLRKVKGVAQHDYAPLALTETELLAALGRAGL